MLKEKEGVEPTVRYRRKGTGEKAPAKSNGVGLLRLQRDSTWQICGVGPNETNSGPCVCSSVGRVREESIIVGKGICRVQVQWTHFLAVLVVKPTPTSQSRE